MDALAQQRACERHWTPSSAASTIQPFRPVCREIDMRFMMLMIPKGYEQATPGTTPDAKAVGAMMKYNEELQKAGVLLALEGLHPPSMGARISFAGGKP